VVGFVKRLTQLALIPVVYAGLNGSWPLPAFAAQSDVLARQALEQLPALQAGVSLDQWRRDHAEDSLTPYHQVLTRTGVDGWCVRSTSETELAPERRLRRIAYFFPPSPPESLTLPGPVDPVRLRGQCRLGFVSLEVAEADSQRARILGEATRRSLSAALGAADSLRSMRFWGAGSWRDRSLWTAGDALVVSAIKQWPRARDRDAEQSPATVFVLGLGTLSGIHFAGFTAGTGGPEQRAAVARHHGIATRAVEAIGLAALPGDAADGIRSWLARFGEDPFSPRPWTAEEIGRFTVAAERWLTLSAALPAPRRAAGLLAADLLLNELERVVTLGDPDRAALRDRFGAHGAAFNYSPLGQWFVYTRTWLKRALELDPEGRAGELAFLTLMELGFETSGTCKDQRRMGFREVVGRGEDWLRARPASAIEAELRLLVAHAYSDIVTLGSGGGYNGADSATFAAEVPRARARAIEQYRRTIPGIADSAAAREAWTHAWRLLAALTPARTWFYCIYD